MQVTRLLLSLCPGLTLLVWLLPLAAAAREAEAASEPPLVADPSLLGKGTEPSGPLFSMKALGGPGWMTVRSVPVFGVDFELGAGITFGRRFAFYGVLGAFTGSTEHGLQVDQWWVGGGVERIFDRIRIGVEQRFGGLRIERATTGDHLSSGTIGAVAFTTIDLFETGSVSYSLGARLGLDLGPGAVFAPGLTVGIRYR